MRLTRLDDPLPRLASLREGLPPQLEDVERLEGLECFELAGDGFVAVLGGVGARFVGDRIRWGWLMRERGVLPLAAVIRALRPQLPALGVCAVRWVVPWEHGARQHRAWMRLGARTVDVNWEAPERWVTFQIDERVPLPTARTHRGQELGPPMLSEWALLERWSHDPRVVEPLRLDHGLSREELMRHAYGSLRTRGPRRAQLWMVRRGGEPVGVSLEYVWHYTGDGIREIDTALPEGDPSPKTLLDAIAGAMHLAYRTGATETIGNVRQPFPRLFARVGGTDRTNEINRFGKALEGRYYYVASADAFYASREGRAFRRGDGGGAAMQP